MYLKSIDSIKNVCYSIRVIGNSKGIKIMKFLTVNFTRELTAAEQKELMTRYEGQYFCLNEVLKNGMKILVKMNDELNNFDIEEKTKNYYKKFGCIFS